MRPLVFVTVVCLLAGAAVGEDDQLRPADTSSPQGTLRSFIDDCNTIHALLMSEPRGREAVHEQYGHIYRRMLSCLDLSEVPEYLRRNAGLETAVCLKEVFDRIELPPFADVPDAAAVRESPEASLRWRVPGTAITIARVDQGARAGEYLFSAETVSRATEFYELVSQMPYRTGGSAVTEGLYDWFVSAPGSDRLATVVEVLPDWSRRRVRGQALWQWAGLIATFLGGGVVVWLAYRVSRSRAAVGPDAGVLRQLLKLLLPLALIAVPLWGRGFIADDLAIHGTPLVVARVTLHLFFMAGLTYMVVAVFHWIAETIIASPRIQPKSMDAQFIRLVSRILALVAVVVVFLEGGQYLGISLTTLLAGAGVGGLALALSAQDLLRNVLGSLVILLDRPYRMGDYIIAHGYEGVVEEIGIRSTRIRLLNDHVTSIPNETMAKGDIENIGRRGCIARSTDIRLALDTSAEQTARAIEIIRGILEDHEGMDPGHPPRVHLSDFASDALIVRMRYWFRPPNYWDFMAFGNEVNLRIKRELEAAGIEFARPVVKAFVQPGTATSPAGHREGKEP